MGEQDRVNSSIVIVPCDASHRIAGNPVTVRRIPWRSPLEERRLNIANLLAAAVTGPAILVGVGVGTGAGLPEDLARSWRLVVQDQCDASGITLAGFYNCSLKAVTEVHPSTSMVSSPRP